MSTVQAAAPPRFLTASELADVLGVTDQTVRVWARTGQVPCRRLPSGTVRFDLDEVTESMDAPPRRKARVAP